MLTGFAYVLTVLSNIQYSNFERAHRYFATALQHFEKLKTRMRQSSWPVVERRDEEFIGQLEALLYEAVSQTQLILGNPRDTLNNVCNKVDVFIRINSNFCDGFFDNFWVFNCKYC